MSTVTVPKKITGGEELIILPRREYEELLKFPEEKKTDLELEKALEDVRQGRVIGPFTNSKDLIDSLEK